MVIDMMNLQEITRGMSKLDNWVLDGEFITKEIEFSEFKKAMDFVNEVAKVAEKNNHHPEIIINFNVVRLSLTTHSAKSLTDLDFKVAEEIDKIYEIPSD
ncbi:MAG: 4a-hydroxytetrahydrobiopterin dehydratase [archaeon]